MTWTRTGVKETGMSITLLSLMVRSTAAKAISPENDPVQLDDVKFTDVSIDSWSSGGRLFMLVSTIDTVRSQIRLTDR